MIDMFINQMKNIGVILLAVLLVRQSVTVSCIIGYYDPGSSVKCM